MHFIYTTCSSKVTIVEKHTPPRLLLQEQVTEVVLLAENARTEVYAHSRLLTTLNGTIFFLLGSLSNNVVTELGRMYRTN